MASLRSLLNSLLPRRRRSAASNRAVAGQNPATEHSSAAELDGDWLIVGLGNPGTAYEGTRHNVGFLAVDAIAEQLGITLAPVDGLRSEAGAGSGVVLLKPTTFMNSSGEAVAPLSRRLGLAPDQIIVIHDELDLPIDRVRLKLGGQDNGHNGLKSVTAELGTADYYRVRIGISRPPRSVSIIDHVLGPIDEGQEGSIALAVEAVGLLRDRGLGAAQTDIHGRRADIGSADDAPAKE